MASTQSVSVELPEDLYQRIRELAERSDSSVEAVVREGLEEVYGAGSPSTGTLRARLQAFRDEELWAVVHQRLNVLERARLDELSARAEREKLSDSEQAELNSLMDQVDLLMLLRSHALLLLKERGHDIARYLPGA